MKAHVSDWIFNYNSFTKNWVGVKREHQVELFNGGPNRVESKSFPTLLDLINRTNGDGDKLNKLTSNVRK